MQPSDLRTLDRPADYALFSDEEARDIIVSDPQLDHCLFRNIRLRNAQFQGGKLTHNQFTDVYLNSAKFEGVDLTGTKFERCDLRHAHFSRCKLWYVEFHRCHLDFDAVRESIPQEVNLKRQFLRSLRVNASRMGDARQARKLLDLELAAEREEQYSILTACNDYFAENFNLGQRITACRRWITQHIQSLVWGYGLRLDRLLCTGALVILVFAIVNWAFGAEFSVSPDDTRILPFWQSLYVSAVTFSTLGSSDFCPANIHARATAVIESLCGCVFLGLFAAAAYRRIRP